MTKPDSTTISPELRSEIDAHLAAVLEVVRSRAPQATGPVPAADEAIFDVLTSRRFCYLGRKRTAPYREATLSLLRRDMEQGEPVRFYFDVGPGYHASTRPGTDGLVFDVGLSELFVLQQIVRFCNRVREVYPPGARFSLVIDNFCALATNDIPVESTSAYCERLRALIAETGTEDVVDLIVESEAFSLPEYEQLLAGIEAQPPPSDLSDADLENVVRFLGRSCEVAEAGERVERYRRSGIVTEMLLERVVHGVRMTQRATGATLGFRPFAGGDQRTQCGEVALTHRSKGGLKPVLLTSRNIDDYHCATVENPEVLPPSIPRFSWAEPRA